jgi:hypothetical protein
MEVEMDLEEYLNDMIALGEKDPPDSDYQQGYHDCLLEMRRVFFPTPEPAKQQKMADEFLAENNLLNEMKMWLIECHTWLLSTDLDMKCPMKIDPLHLVEKIDRILEVRMTLHLVDNAKSS